MTTPVVIIVILLTLLIAFAIYKKDCVRASFKLYRIGFSIEAKDNEPKKPTLPSS
jgi:uncharacterized membrane protein YsdA (DUF1294 family)